jgi:hypothetical protein
MERAAAAIQSQSLAADEIYNVIYREIERKTR